MDGAREKLIEIVRPLVAALRKVQRRLKVMMASTITKEQLIADLHALGIAKGDAIFLHASLSNLGYIEGGAQAVLEALYEAVSPGGTLIIPTYHTVGGTMYKTCLAADEYIFDPCSSPTELGMIPTTFLKFPGVYRSIHPTHSVSAAGEKAKYVTEAHHLSGGPCGADSPWDRFMKLEGKVLGLGISMGPVTFYHMLEDMLPDAFPLPVRMQETYRLKCRDWDGNLLEVPVAPMDPEYVKRRIDQRSRKDLRDYFWEEFEQAGLLTTGRVGEAKAWYIPARGFYDHLVELMREGITIYASPKELRKHPVLKRD